VAEQGHTEAQIRLGHIYDYGEGIIPEDNALAVKWLTKAAEQGDPDAQFDIARKHRDGEGVPVDHVLAHAWFSMAAAQGGDYHKQIKAEFEMNLSEDQIAEAQKLASEWSRD